MEKKDDTLIIGAGAVGLACAYFLNRAGRSVRVVDRGEAGHGTSYGNCGLITPSHAMPMCTPANLRAGLASIFKPAAPLRVKFRADPDFLGWAWRYVGQCRAERAEQVMAAKAALLVSSRRLMERLIRVEGLACQWSSSGLLAVANTVHGVESLGRLAAQAERVDVPVRVVDGAEARRIEPALLDSICGGVLFAGDAVLRPAQYCRELARVCRAKGVEIDTGVEVDSVEWGEGSVAATAGQQRFEARKLIVATGVWSRAFLKRLGLAVPVEPGKGYTLTSPRPDPCPRQALLLEERRIAVTPWEDGYRLGGTMEFAGFDTEMNRPRLDALVEGAAEYLAEPIAPGPPEPWFGFRPMTPDDLPLIGPVADRPGLLLACGHNMLGMSMSVATGRLVAEMVLGRASHVDPSPYDPNRFLRRASNTVAGLITSARRRLVSR